MRRRIAVAGTTTVVAAVGILVGLAATAHAEGPNSVIKQNTTSYSSPSTRSQAVHTGLTPGTRVTALCFIQSEPVHGNTYWFKIEKDGKLAWVYRDAISVPANIQGCPLP